MKTISENINTKQILNSLFSILANKLNINGLTLLINVKFLSLFVKLTKYNINCFLNPLVFIICKEKP